MNFTTKLGQKIGQYFVAGAFLTVMGVISIGSYNLCVRMIHGQNLEYHRNKDSQELVDKISMGPITFSEVTYLDSNLDNKVDTVIASGKRLPRSAYSDLSSIDAAFVARNADHSGNR